MAVQNPDGTWAGASGTSHESRHYAEETIKQAKAGNAATNAILGDFLGLVWKAMFLILILGALSCILLVFVAGVRGFIILGKTFWLYPVVGILAIVAFVVVKNLLRRVPIVGIIAGLAATVCIFIFGFKGVTSYYTKSDMYFASTYSADFVQDKTSLNEKRYGKGKILAELSAGEKVTVNGISFKREEYNVTTANGITGWIDRAAFPEEAAEMLSININADGFDSEDIAIDREIERLMERYMDVKETGGGTYKGIEMEKHREYSISKNTLNRSIRVNAQTPLMVVEHEAYRDGAGLAESGAKLVLENIVYADDCTILYLTVTDTKVRDLSGTFNTTAWKKSLTATDLETGKKYLLLQADYKTTWRWEQAGDKFKSSIVFFFPPFKSRHFSLTREEPPLPSESKAGYGGILGWIAKITSGGSTAEYLDYNFTEIKVK